MKAWVTERYGSPDDLTLRDVELPRPKPTEVLVRIHAASVNDWDFAMVVGKPFVIRLITGLFRPRVRTVGGDLAGRVEAVGDAVRMFRPGDAVYGDLCMNGFGTFAEYVCAPESCLAPKPPGMTFEQAAAIPQAGMLAVQGLIDKGRIRRGQTLLINGAGGGVGTFAIQIARLFDSEITVVDRAGKLDMLRAMGAHHVIDYRHVDFTRARRCWDLILDTRSTRSPRAYARALTPGGTYVTVGGDTSRLLQLATTAPIVARVSGKQAGVVALKANKDLAYFNKQFEAGEVAPVIDRVYPLPAVREALERFGTGDHHGKIVVSMV